MKPEETKRKEKKIRLKMLINDVEELARYYFSDRTDDDNELAVKGLVGELKKEVKEMSTAELDDFERKVQQALFQPEKFVVAAWGGPKHETF